MSAQRVLTCQDLEQPQRQTASLAQEATCARGTLLVLHRQAQSPQTPAPQASTASQAQKETMVLALGQTPAQQSALLATIAQPRLLPRFLANTAFSLEQTARQSVSSAQQELSVTTPVLAHQPLVIQDMCALRDLQSWRPASKVTRLSRRASRIVL